MKNPITHADAEKKARRMEAKQLAKVLKKLDRDFQSFLRGLHATEQKMAKAHIALVKRNKRAVARAEKATNREKSTILRRLAIINGRGV